MKQQQAAAGGVVRTLCTVYPDCWISFYTVYCTGSIQLPVLVHVVGDRNG